MVSAVKKAEMNFTQSNFKIMDKQQSACGVLSKFLKDYMLLPVYHLTHSSALPAAVMKPVQYPSCCIYILSGPLGPSGKVTKRG